ncbi:MAG: hypothetical protein WDN24_22265 [Sphingomonas sp.]
MKLVLTAAAALAVFSPAALAQTAPAADPAPAEAAAPAAFTVDTPVEALAADERTKAVLEADLPGLLTHPSYEFFKGMSLRQLQPMSEGKITEELLAKVGTDLAAIK